MVVKSLVGLAVVWLGVGALAGAAASAGDRAEEQPFLIGVDYPSDADPKVTALFEEMGLNFARLTGGGYGWATKGHLEAAADLEALGAQVILQLGSHYPTADYFRFTGDYLVDHRGETGEQDRQSWAIRYGKSNWPQYTYAPSDLFRQKMASDFASYLEAFHDRSNVVGVILHNEPGYFWQHERLFDYNPRVIARFRQWLEEQHETVAQLNARWGTEHQSFAAVEPPHDVPVVGQAGAMLDWRRFQVDLIEEYLHWLAEMTRELNPSLPQTTNLAGAINNWYFYRVDDNFQFTRPFDLAGVDIYAGDWVGRLYPDYAMAMTVGVAEGKPAWVLECEVYDGKASLTPGQRADLLYRDLWTYAGRGAKAIAMWSLSGRGGHTLTDGTFNPRVRAVRDMAHQAKLLNLERFDRPDRKVAVVVDPDSYLLAGATEDTPLRRGTAVAEAAQGLYAAVVENHIDADVLFAEQIRAGAWRHYRVLVLAPMPMMDQALADALKQFVSAGGKLVAEPQLAVSDRWGRRLDGSPGYGLAELFKRGDNLLLEGNAGRGHLQGWHNGVLSSRLQALLREAQVPFQVEVQRSDGEPAQVTSSLLSDDRGNHLLVLALPNAKLEPLQAEGPLKVTLRGVDPQLRPYLLGPTDTAEGDGMPALAPLRAKRTEGELTVEVDRVDAAAAILLARDFQVLPVLQGSAAPARPGQTAAMTLAIHNPSDVAVEIEIVVAAPEDVTATPRDETLSVPPGDSASTVIDVLTDRPGRHPIRPRVRPAGHAGEIPAVPIDLHVGE